MNENMEFRSDLLIKWLRVLVYIAIVSIVNSVISILPIIPASVTTWISRGIMVAMVVCMFRLAPMNERYQKAGILRAVWLGCMIASLIFMPSILILTASILSIIAVYQEYIGHSEVVADKDARLSRNWHSLFNWSIVTGLLVGFGSMITALIASFAGVEITRITAIVTGILSVPQLVIEIVYLLYLKKMSAIFDQS